VVRLSRSRERPARGRPDHQLHLVFYKNGQKWEQYTFNKEKKLKSYYVYDKDGKLKP